MNIVLQKIMPIDIVRSVAALHESVSNASLALFLYRPCVLCKTSAKQGRVVVMRLSLTTAKVCATEDLCEGKLHAGICTGASGQPAFLP
jgi:hypothetical protein